MAYNLLIKLIIYFNAEIVQDLANVNPLNLAAVDCDVSPSFFEQFLIF